MNTQLCNDIINTISHDVCRYSLLEYFVNITLDRFSSLGWIMQRQHTFIVGKVPVNTVLHWAHNCLIPALIIVTINDSYNMQQEVDTPLARIFQSNRFANIVTLTLMLRLLRLSISK